MIYMNTYIILKTIKFLNLNQYFMTALFSTNSKITKGQSNLYRLNVCYTGGKKKYLWMIKIENYILLEDKVENFKIRTDIESLNLTFKESCFELGFRI